MNTNNGVLRMLLRMLSACHPGNGANRLIRLPDAVPGQDQDPSKETIVVLHLSLAAHSCISLFLVKEGHLG